MSKEFRNFTKEQVYRVGYWDALKVIRGKIEGKNRKEIAQMLSKMIAEEETDHDMATFMLREGFIDY